MAALVLKLGPFDPARILLLKIQMPLQLPLIYLAQYRCIIHWFFNLKLLPWDLLTYRIKLMMFDMRAIIVLHYKMLTLKNKSYFTTRKNGFIS